MSNNIESHLVENRSFAPSADFVSKAKVAGMGHPDESESTPLLSNGNDDGPRGSLLAQQVNDGEHVVVEPLDEYSPSTYSSVAGGAPMVSCRVCQVTNNNNQYSLDH